MWCSTGQRWHLRCGQIAQLRDPTAVSSALSHDSSLLRPVSTGAQGEWLWTTLCWPLRECLCLWWTVSPWWTESLLIFTAICYMGTSSQFWACESGLELRPHASQEELLQMRYPCGTSTTSCGSGASPSLVFAQPTSLNMALTVNPSLSDFFSASFQLVIQDDCWIF